MDPKLVAQLLMRKLWTAPKALPMPSGGIRAYHGSPYDFDKFDLSKIGTGEGAQAYGHGLYFSEHPTVAQSYRDSLSGNFKFAGMPATGKTFSPTATKSEQTALSALDWFRGDTNKAIASLESRGDADAIGIIQRWDKNGWIQKTNPGRMYEVNINAKPEQFLDWDRPLSAQPDYIRRFFKDAGPPPPHPDPGISSILRRSLRQDEDPRNVALMVDNDFALYQRARAHAKDNNPALFQKMEEGSLGAGEYVQNLARDHLKQQMARRQTGEELYRSITPGFVSSQPGYKEPLHAEASKLLKNEGVPGIRYLDQGSRNQQYWVARHPKGGTYEAPNEQEIKAFIGRNPEYTLEPPKQTSNYVLFNPDLATIVKKYGIAIPGAGAAVGAALDQPSEP